MSDGELPRDFGREIDRVEGKVEQIRNNAATWCRHSETREKLDQLEGRIDSLGETVAEQADETQTALYGDGANPGLFEQVRKLRLEFRFWLALLVGLQQTLGDGGLPRLLEKLLRFWL